MFPLPAMRESATVRLTLIDEAHGSTLGEVELCASRLPESFSAATTLHLADDAWEVVHAEPAESAEYIACGTLRLTVRHVAREVSPRDPVDTHHAPFRRPSLVDPLPPVGGTAPPGSVLELSEDAWRQIELVTMAARETVALEIAAIGAVAARSVVPGGYRAAHARRAVRDPLAGVTLTLEDLRGVFGRVEPMAAVALRARAGVVLDGYAFRTAGGLTVYGTAPGGRVTALGLMPHRERPGPPVDAPALASLRRAHELLMVDWDARVVIPPPTSPSAGNN